MVLGKKSQSLRVEILRLAKYYPSLDFLESSIIAARGRKCFSSVPPATPGEGETGCRDGVPAGGLGAKPLRFSVVKKHIFTVGGFSISTYISNIVYIVSSFRVRNPLFSRLSGHEKTPFYS